MKRLISLLLAVVCLLTVPSFSALSEEEATPITLFYTTARSTNEYTDMTHEYIKKNLGIDMKVFPGSGEWKQQLSLYVSTGDVPDIVAYMDTITYQTYAEQGVWYDITNLVDSYENIRPYVSSQTNDPDSVWARLTVDGKLYGIPYMSGMPTKYLNVLRKDWMDKLNLEIPTTLDELTDVLRAFTFDDPDGDGVDNTYGFGNASALNNLCEFFGAFGVSPKEDTLLMDGKLYTSVISDGYRQALSYLHDIYDEGLIHPEIFTMTETQRYEEWVRGAYGCTTWWWTHTGNSINRYGFFDANPDADIVFFDPVSGPDGYSGHIAEDDISQVIAISANCANVDKALQLLNFQASYDGYCTVYLGVEGQFWTKGADGKRDWDWTIENKDKFGNSINDMEYYKILGNNRIQNESKMLMESSKRNDILMEQVQRPLVITPIRNAFVGIITPEFQQYSSETAKFYTDATIKFITGDKNLDEEWDSYVQGYLDCGGAAIRESMLEVYNEANGTNYEFGN